MRVLVDTNVIIDALTSREPWNQYAEKIFIMAANRNLDMYMTASSATDIYYLVRKYLHSTEQAKHVMGKLYSLTGILPATEVDCIDALASAVIDYEDAVIERVAAKADMDYIVTRNRKGFQQGTVKAILPEELIVLMEQKK
ncbi:MAG: PIN domain-containing protein [Lachnospiraceae bacterium]|nr:PIN domain-containing protein [Lachnospiraceae bacterium]